MKSKNDVQFIHKLNGQQRFSFRKISIGLCTIALGTVFLMSNSQDVKADSVAAGQTTETANPSSTTDKSQVTVKPDGSTDPNKGKLPTDPEASANSDSKKAEPISEKVKPVSSYQDHDQDSLTKFGDRDMTITWKNPEKQVMAGQDDVQVHINIHNLPASQAGQDYSLKLNNDDWTINSSLNYQGGLSAKVADDKKSIDFTVNQDFNNQGEKATDLDFDLTLLGNPAITKPVKAPISFTFSDNSQPMFTNDQIVADMVPLKDKVGNEFAKVFWMNYKTDKTNVPENLQDKKILQWGVYWNYDGATLNNLHYKQSFSAGQKIIPTSLKVFEVKPGQAVNPDGTRKSIADYYNQVTTGVEDANMESLLKNHITNDQSEIDVPTIPGAFSLNNQDYSKKMFFIQMDTDPDINYVENVWTKPGNGPASTVEPSNYSNQVFSGSYTLAYKGFSFNGKFDPSDGEYKSQLFVGEVAGNKKDDANAPVSDLGTALQKENKLTFSNLTAISKKTNEIHFSNENLALPDYIKAIEDQGYEFIGISTGKFNNKKDLAKADQAASFAKADNFGNFSQTPKDFTLLFTPKIVTKTVTETINFVDENGKAIKDPVTNRKITFTSTANVWDKDSDSFKEFVIPAKIDNFDFKETKAATTPDGKTLASVTVNPDSQDVVLTLVYAKHVPVKSTKTIKENIRFVDENGTDIKKPLENGTITFTATDGKWDKNSDSFKEFTIPQTIENYKFDHTDAKTSKDSKSLAAVTVKPDSQDVVLILVYKLEQPAKPNKPVIPDKPDNKPTPTPSNPDNKPVDPTPTPQPLPQPTPETPDLPEVPDVPTENTDEDIPMPHANEVPTEENESETVQPHASVAENVTVSAKADHKVKVNTENTVKPLPQTGAKENNASLLGLALAGVASMFGLAAGKKRKN